jgi:hypothetical protein
MRDWSNRLVHRLAPCFAVALGGCLNSSTTIVGAGDDPIPDLAPAQERATPEVRTSTLDRSQWPLITVHQPSGQVESSFFGGPDPAFALQRGPTSNPEPQPVTFR